MTAAALFGIVDLGTWNIRFSINSIQPHHARILPCVFQDRAPIRLFKGADIPITEEEIKETIVALKRFSSICSTYGVPLQNVRIAANPHEAPNLDDLIERIRVELKLDVLRLSKEGEHWANAYGIAASVYEARGMYIELRPSHANLYYLNLSNTGPSADDSEEEFTAAEALIGPVKVPYIPNTKYRVHSPDENADNEHGNVWDVLELRDFHNRLKEACLTLAEKAYASGTASSTVFLSSSGFYGLHTLLSHASQGFRMVTDGLVMQPSTLLELKVNSKLSHVVQIVGSSLPEATKRIVYVHHNLRNGLLFQALPPQIRHQDPLLVATKPYALPGARKLAEELRNTLPKELCPAFIRDRLVRAVANAAYVHSSYSTEVQSISALLVAETGLLSGAHGMTHEDKALLGIALCQRWGGFLNDTGRAIYDEVMESVTDPKLVYWAMYLGMILYLLGAAYPGANVRPDAVSISTELVNAETGQFKLIVHLTRDSLYGDNVIMDTRIKRTRSKLESLNGIKVDFVVTKV